MFRTYKKGVNNGNGKCCQINPSKVGIPWRYTYLNVHRDDVSAGQELFNAIARYDRKSKQMAIADMGKNRYPSEPILVSDSDNSQQGWLLTVVYDGDTDKSEVRIYQSNSLAEDPVCCIALPQVIPPGFHGTWKSD